MSVEATTAERALASSHLLGRPLKGERDSADAYLGYAMSQLSRILLSSTSGSPDEQAVVPEEGGGYGELMEEINRVIQHAPQSEEDEPRR